MRDVAEILEELLLEQRIANSLLRLASSVELDQLVDRLTADAIDAAIIRALADGQKSGSDLTAEVAAEENVTPRSVQLHLAQLIPQGIVQRIGGGNRIAYVLTPLFSSSQLSRLRLSGSRAAANRE